MKFYIKTYNGGVPFLTYFILSGTEILIITRYSDNEETTSQTVLATSGQLKELETAAVITDAATIAKLTTIKAHIQSINDLFKK